MPQKGYKQTKDHRNKLSRLNKLGITGMLGKHQSNRQKIIASQTHKNKFVSLDTRKKMSLAKLNDKDLSARNKRNRAKQISPVKDTSIEVKIQDYLKELNIEFFTHQYIKEIEHSYQCDIIIRLFLYGQYRCLLDNDANNFHHIQLLN